MTGHDSNTTDVPPEGNPTALVSSGTDGGLSLIPLGGLGEIGMNCMAYEYEGQIMLVDCGVNFPEQRDYGVDLIIPSFAYLIEHADRVCGLVVTHGHEDHIGAIPYLLRELNPPIHGTALSLALVERKLREHGLYEHAKLVETRAGDTVSVGPFEVEFIHVNHSIPQAISVAVKTPVGTVIQTGDYKIEHNPPGEDPIDLARFAALGEQGVLCLLGDSTNVLRPGYSSGEGEVAAGLASAIEKAPGRVIVTLFASNLHRIQSLLDCAHQTGRRVLLLGRSLLQNVATGRELGLIRLPEGLSLIQAKELEAFRDDQLLILTTGSQGEPRSALTRIAMGDHRWFSARTGDLVIFSSRIIPGNETSVGRVINHLYRRGATILQQQGEGSGESGGGRIHASGHGCLEELKVMLSLTQPEFFLPVHGEYRHLVAHAKLAEALGAAEAFVAENGQVLTLWRGDAELTGRVTAGRVFVAGTRTEDLPSLVLRDRRKLARTGIVVAWVVIDGNTGEIVGGPELHTIGIAAATGDDQLLAEAKEVAVGAIEELNDESRRVSDEVAEAMRRAIRRLFKRRIESKPVVVPIVHEL